jgi:antibiotic biosynthesis monooxygenase (ABM) superfamily enzyme
MSGRRSEATEASVTRTGGEATREEGLLATSDPPESSRWWIPVAVVATVVPVSAALLWVAGVAGEYLPAGGRLLLPLYWALVVGTWLFSPFAVHYDQLYLASRTGYVPSAYYYAVFVPALGTLVAVAYLVHRYRVVRRYRTSRDRRN